MGICCVTQGTQTEALYQPRGVGWEGDGREVQEGGDICTPYGWFMLLSDRKQQTSESNYTSIKK